MRRRRRHYASWKSDGRWIWLGLFSLLCSLDTPCLALGDCEQGWYSGLIIWEILEFSALPWSLFRINSRLRSDLEMGIHRMPIKMMRIFMMSMNTCVSQSSSKFTQSKTSYLWLVTHGPDRLKLCVLIVAVPQLQPFSWHIRIKHYVTINYFQCYSLMQPLVQS